MLNQGLSVIQILSLLGVDNNTIYRHVKAYRKVGIQVYLSNNFVVYQGRLTQEQLEPLDIHLSEHCCVDAKSITRWILSQFGIFYTPTDLIPLLYCLDYVYKRSKTVPSKADESKQKAFLEEQFFEILAEVSQDKAHLYYSDGVHPVHLTHTGYGWIKRGEDFGNYPAALGSCTIA